jgi:DNA-binding transcriptional MerR regulator
MHKIEGRYRPGSWVLITNEYDEFEEENFEVENFVCTECSEKCKRSFNGQKVLKRKEVMPVLKERVLIKGDIAVSKPLAWIMRPKKEVPKVEQTIPIRIISAPMKKVPVRPMTKKTAKIEAVAERIIQEKKIRINYPPVVQAKNDRNAANPRPGSPQHIKNITAKKDPGVSLDEYKKKLANEREHIQIEYEKTMEQREALQELYKQRAEEYETVKRFMEFLTDFYVPEMRYYIISTWILRNRFDTVSAIMALKHHGKTLSNKERNRLMHALNGNMAMQATCIALAGAALTYLIRRNRMAVATPIYNHEGMITGHTLHTAAPSAEAIAEENADAALAANALGGNIADLINRVRTQNEEFQAELLEQRNNFQRELQEQRLARTSRPGNGTNQSSSTCAKNRSTGILFRKKSTWLRRMNYYFGQNVTDGFARMTYSIQRIRKGKNNRAANWANGKIGEQANFDEERVAFIAAYPGRTYTTDEIFTVIPEAAATATHEAWPVYEFVHKPPFRSWEDFTQQARDYFLTTETRDMAIKKLRNTTQKGDIEEYLTEFKGWANLAGFDDVALVDQFKTGLKKGLGRRIMETGNPGDGTTPGQLQEWYKKALELERAYREAEQYYGKKEFTFKGKFKPKNATAGPSTSQTVTVKVKDENAMDVDKTTTTRPPPRCYNCQKMGHIAKHCRNPKVERTRAVESYFDTMTDEEKEEMKRKLGFLNDQ